MGVEVNAMSESLHVDLSDHTIDAIRRQANANGTTPSRLAADALEATFSKGDAPPTAHDSQETAIAARERFERHFGAVDLGHATGANNRSIDEDLAREYAANPEGD